ncbi:MAG: hypothetical protein C0467_05475 [Planctomycetaceae bacterium]|nr:hypothetical protein [Planctomycetaceae bacterium]
MSLPTAQWTVALDRMTETINRNLVELDRHRTEWATVTDSPATVTPPDMLLAWLERRLGQWDARLTASAELAATVEKQLSEREATVARWQETFGRWRELVEQGLNPAPMPASDVPE